MRLANETEVDGGIRGRVEICHNRAWGTVCNTYFNGPEAAVVCASFPGFMRDGKIVPQ